MTEADELLGNYRSIAESALGIARGNLEDTIRSANRAVVAEAQKRQAEGVSDKFTETLTTPLTTATGAVAR